MMDENGWKGATAQRLDAIERDLERLRAADAHLHARLDGQDAKHSNRVDHEADVRAREDKSIAVRLGGIDIEIAALKTKAALMGTLGGMVAAAVITALVRSAAP